MKNKLNPSKTRASKQSNLGLDGQKLKYLLIEPVTREIKSNKNLNLINKKLNNSNQQNKNITNTETKNPKKSISNTDLCRVEVGANKNIFSDMKIKENSKGNKFKNSDKIVNENLFPDTRKNINKDKKHNVSETASLKEIDSISDDNNESLENIMQNHNMNIKSEVNLNLKENNNKKNDKKKKINLNSTKLVTQITSFNNIIQNNRNKNEIKSTKTVVPKK